MSPVTPRDRSCSSFSVNQVWSLCGNSFIPLYLLFAASRHGSARDNVTAGERGLAGLGLLAHLLAELPVGGAGCERRRRRRGGRVRRRPDGCGRLGGGSRAEALSDPAVRTADRPATVRPGRAVRPPAPSSARRSAPVGPPRDTAIGGAAAAASRGRRRGHSSKPIRSAATNGSTRPSSRSRRQCRASARSRALRVAGSRSAGQSSCSSSASSRRASRTSPSDSTPSSHRLGVSAPPASAVRAASTAAVTVSG